MQPARRLPFPWPSLWTPALLLPPPPPSFLSNDVTPPSVPSPHPHALPSLHLRLLGSPKNNQQQLLPLHWILPSSSWPNPGGGYSPHLIHLLLPETKADDPPKNKRRKNAPKLGKRLRGGKQKGESRIFSFSTLLFTFLRIIFISNLIPFFRGGSLQGPEAQNLCKKVLWTAAGSTVREILNMFSLLLIIVIF